MTVQDVPGGLDLTCTQLVWAGGQQTAPGKLHARVRQNGDQGEKGMYRFECEAVGGFTCTLTNTATGATIDGVYRCGDSLGFLETTTRGYTDLLCNSIAWLRFDGKEYQLAR